ncbi:Organic solute transporter alpha-like protein [Lucilia cuprina]|uniref:Organic solute transporter alpha-like protein n=1 Tax=Lucilia cuprina TaxID=7375 RepID=A0A0L0CAS1_LUCCU|nr:Organic solute transporter alpha-like protein [Lucilia cuprina]KNC28554.1 Organic solute transporter alpha-like protein [Lucilia cuprina]
MSSNIKYFHHHHLEQGQQQHQHQLSLFNFTREISNVTELDPSIFWHPTLSDYYNNLTPFITLSVFVATLLLLLNISIFCTTVSRVKRRVNVYFRGPTIVLCSLYPIICCAALTTILLPKSWLICHTVMHLCFTVGAVMFRQLCFRYVDSEVNYMKETDGAAVTINTPPCCCCCLCLPAMVPSKAKFCLLRYMVWQMPFVQGCIMLVLNVIYYREQSLYQSVSLYFIPFIVCSILVGLWGLNITVRMVNVIHSEYNLMKKMFCLQLILLLCKLQYLLLDSQLNHLVLGGEYPINHTIYKQTIINLLILCEMVLVSMLAQNAYKIPT